MCMKILRRQVGFVIFFITACQNDSADNNKPVELNVTTATSEVAVLAGVFKSPCMADDVNNDMRDDGLMHFFSFSGRSITTYTHHYLSATDCSGVPVVLNRCELNVISTTEAKMNAWVDKLGQPAAPPATAADDSVLLPSKPAYTSITAEVMQTDFKARIGMSVPYGFVVDNSRDDGLKIYSTQFNFIEGQAGVEAFHSSF